MSRLRSLRLATFLSLLVTSLVAQPLIGLSQDGAAKLPSASDAAVELYSTAATAQNEGEFEAAAGFWAELLEKYPNIELSPKAEQYCGVCNLKLKRFETAAKHFRAVVTQWSKHSDQSDLEDAYLNLGWCYYSLAGERTDGKKELLDEAARTFDQLTRKFPRGRYVDQALYFHGEALYQQDKVNEAVQAYARLVITPELRDSPLRAGAAYALGVAQEEQKRYSHAERAFDLFLRDYPNHELATEVRMRMAQSIMQRGLTLQKTNSRSDATQLLQQAAKIFEGCAATENFAHIDHALFQQARCLVELEQFREAATLYARIATELTDSAYAKSAALNAGRSFYRGEEYPDAMRWFQRVIRTDPTHAAEASHWSCRVLLLGGEANRAAALAQRALKDAADSDFLIQLKMDLADGWFEDHRQKRKAVELYLEIAQNHPDDPVARQALYNAAYGALELKQVENALAYTKSFRAEFPGSALLPDVGTVSAESYLLKGEYVSAETAYRDLLASFPEHTDRQRWQVRLGLTLQFQEKHEESIKLLASILKQVENPELAAEARHLLGAAHFAVERYDVAVENFSAALSAHQWQKADETTLLLARAQRKLNRLDDAIHTVGHLMESYPESALLDEATYRYGEYWYAAGQYKNAALQYSAVIANWPDSPFATHASYGLGWSLLKQNQFAKALSPFDEIVENHSKHPLAAQALYARGICRRQLSDFRLALQDIDSFLASRSKSANQSDALFEKGLCHAGLQDYAAAAASFETFLKKNPQSAVADRALYEWGWALKSAGQIDDATKAFRDLAKSYPVSEHAPEALFHSGEDHYRSKHYEQAATDYDQAIGRVRSLPDSAEQQAQSVLEQAMYKLGWSRYKLRQYRPALTAFREQTEAFHNGKLHADGLFMVAECLFHLRDYDQAITAYESAGQKLHDASEDVQVTLLLHSGQSALELGRNDVALDALEKITMEYPKSDYLAETYLEMGRALYATDQKERALQAFQETAERSFSVLGARARFMIGEILFSRKEHDAAIREFQRVIFGYQRAGNEISNWKAKSCYEAARCSEVQISSTEDPQMRSKFIADAKKFYGYVVSKYPEHELADQAKKRLDMLARL